MFINRFTSLKYYNVLFNILKVNKSGGHVDNDERHVSFE